MKKRELLRNIFMLTGILLSFSMFLSLASAQGAMEGWSGDVFAGYSMASGNTDKSSANLTAQAAKKFEKSVFLLKGNMFYSETNKKMDTQKWDLLAKYTLDFGEADKWFSFYQVLFDHDYFADVNYRVTPAAGIGYHIARSEDWTWDVDAGLGYRITRYRVNKSQDDEVLTAIAHTFMKKKVFTKAFLSEDFTAYPGLKSGSAVVCRSESAFTNPLNEKLDLELKYIVDYNSEPADDKSTTDKQFIAGIKYKF